MPPDAVWHSEPLSFGDVLLFEGLTVHGPWHNTTAKDVRLSVDFRYEPTSAVNQQEPSLSYPG